MCNKAKSMWRPLNHVKFNKPKNLGVHNFTPSKWIRFRFTDYIGLDIKLNCDREARER